MSAKKRVGAARPVFASGNNARATPQGGPTTAMWGEPAPAKARGQATALKRVLREIRRFRTSGPLPSKKDLCAWAVHPDPSVPLATISLLNEKLLITPALARKATSKLAAFAAACVPRAVKEARATGVMWTPLLDSLDADSSACWGDYECKARMTLEAELRFARAWLMGVVGNTHLDLLRVIRSPRLRDAIVEEASSLDVKDVDLALDTSVVPPPTMIWHPGLQPEAAAVLGNRLRKSYLERLRAVAAHPRRSHFAAVADLEQIGFVLNVSREVAGIHRTLEDQGFVTDVESLLFGGILDPRAIGSAARVVIKHDQSANGDRLLRVWTMLGTRGLHDAVPPEYVHAHPHFAAVELDIVTNAVHHERDAFDFLEYSSEMCDTTEVADCLATCLSDGVRARVLALTSPRVFKGVFRALARKGSLQLGMIEEASEPQVAMLAQGDWKSVRRYDREESDGILARIPSARTTPDVRAGLLTSRDVDVLVHLCCPTETTAKECAALFDRVAKRDVNCAATLLGDDNVTRVLRAKQLLPLLTSQDSDVRGAATMAVAKTKPTKRALARTRSR